MGRLPFLCHVSAVGSLTLWSLLLAKTGIFDGQERGFRQQARREGHGLGDRTARRRRVSGQDRKREREREAIEKTNAPHHNLDPIIFRQGIKPGAVREREGCTGWDDMRPLTCTGSGKLKLGTVWFPRRFVRPLGRGACDAAASPCWCCFYILRI